MEKLISKSFERLVEKGLSRGFITYEELQKSLGKRNANVESLEKSVLHIFDQAISFVKKNQILKLKKQNPKQLSSQEIKTEVMTLLECICERWEAWSCFLEKEKLQLLKE